MSITKQDCIGLLRQQGASDLDATQTVETLLEKKARLAADGKLERVPQQQHGGVDGKG